MWSLREFRILRWFMRLAGVGLLIPGAILAMFWPDTILAFRGALVPALAVPAAIFSIAALALGGTSFIAGRLARPGALLAASALLLGALVHVQWSSMMGARMEQIPEGLGAEQRAMIEDTVRFAANSQIPHALKNLVLVGVCAVVFVLGPTVCRACRELSWRTSDMDA